MNLRISTILPVIISALVVMGVASSGFSAYRAYGTQQKSEAFLEINQISQLLLRSAGQWAIERGLTNAPLKSPELASAERRAEIVKTRATSDRAFSQAVLRLREVPEMRAAEQRILEAENAFRRFQSFRGRVYENLAKPGPKRETEVVEWICARQYRADPCRGQQTAAHPRNADDPSYGRNGTACQSSSSDGADGRECGPGQRGSLGGAIAAHEKLTADDIGRIADFRGRVVLAWETISPVSQRADVSAKVANAIAGVEKDYFRTYGELRGTKCGRAG